MFTFLSPLFLVGVAAAGIPLVIHLSRSRRTKRMPFSTTRFFTDRFVRSYRMSRLKEMLLLVARMALFAVFAAALARPLFLPQGRAFLTGRRCVVLVVDNSASMGYVQGGVSLIERAKAGARELLDGLREGDTASIVLAGRRADGPETIFPEPTSELGDVRQALDQVGLTTLGTDLTGAIARAEGVAAASNARSREIYVLSDLQDAGWELRDEEGGGQSESEYLYFFVRLRPEQPENLSVTAIHYAAARPMVGIPFSVRPHIRNEGSGAAAADVALFIDDDKVGEKRLDEVRAGRWTVPRFHHTFSSGGWHSGYVEVVPDVERSHDGLLADNRRYFAFEVLDSVPVLAVNGSPSNVARLDELFFLRTALTASGEGESPIRLQVTTPGELQDAELAAYPLIILANVESLPLAAVEKLEAYVDRGGSLFVFLGDKANRVFYNSQLAAPARLHGGLLPGRLGDLAGDPEASEPGAGFVADVAFDHPALAAFEDPGFARLRGVTFKALWSVEPGTDSSLLMRTSNGAPLLCERTFGKGRVLLFASTCDRDWTDFPVRPAFLPWIHRLVAYLVQEPLGRDGFIATGEVVPLRVSAGTGIQPLLIKTPDGTLAHPVTTTDPAAPLVFEETMQTGIYAAHEADEPPRLAGLFAANLEAYESDLTYLDDVLAGEAAEAAEGHAGRVARVEAGFKELLPGRPLISYVDDPARLAEASLTARRGVRLWDIFLAAVLVLALFEPWLANRISRRHYAQPAPPAERAVLAMPAQADTGR